MKTTHYLQSMLIFSLGLLLLAVTSCDNDETVDPPLAFFTATVNESDNLIWNFTNESQGGKTYSWDFGDGVGTSTEPNPTYTYAAAGTYQVALTAINEGGEHTYSESITVLSNTAVNLIVNGEFDSDASWTVQQFNTYQNAVVTIAEGVLTVTEVNPDAGWGAEAHGGVWQMVTIEAGTYLFDMEVVTAGADEMWAEMWIGNVEPADADDYNTDDGAANVLALNTWNCPDQANHSGSLAADNCTDSNTLELDAGTYYVVIRTGGITFPESGIQFDNITMFKQ